jgi:hypothetical protein
MANFVKGGDCLYTVEHQDGQYKQVGGNEITSFFVHHTHPTQHWWWLNLSTWKFVHQFLNDTIAGANNLMAPWIRIPIILNDLFVFFYSWTPNERNALTEWGELENVTHGISASGQREGGKVSVCAVKLATSPNMPRPYQLELTMCDPRSLLLPLQDKVTMCAVKLTNFYNTPPLYKLDLTMCDPWRFFNTIDAWNHMKRDNLT